MKGLFALFVAVFNMGLLWIAYDFRGLDFMIITGFTLVIYYINLLLDNKK